MKNPAKRAGEGAAAAQSRTGAGGRTKETGEEAEDEAADAASTDVAAAAGDAPEEKDGSAGAAGAEPAPSWSSPEEQVAELKDRLLRAMAETENVRRRAERDREEAQKYAVTGLARDLVGIVDNLHRAIEAAPATADQDEGVLKSLLVGVELTQRELLAVLERHDIRAINPIGEKFNPNYHQAMFEVPETGQAPGTIVEVTEVGYAIADRLLRPAAVGVAAASRDGDGDGAQPRIDTTV